MTPYEYEVMQDPDAFGREMIDTVTKLPQDLTFSPLFNDFIIQLLVLDKEYRPKTRDICAHPWLEGSFDSLITPKQYPKQKSKHRPSINEALNQTDFAPFAAAAKSRDLGLSRLDSSEFSVGDNGHMVGDDISNSPSGHKGGALAVSFPRLPKEKSQLAALEIEDKDNNVPVMRSPSKIKGESPRGSGSSSILLNKKSLGSPSSSGVHGEDYGPISNDNMEGSDPTSRVNMILPPIGDRLTSRSHEGMTYSMQDEDDQAECDSNSDNTQSLMNAAISSLSKGGSRRMDICQSPPLTQSSPLDPECSSGGNSCNSAGSGVSFFGYGNRQYSAPRGSFANDLSAPRGSFANDAYANPRGSFMSDCGTGPRSSFFNENLRASKDHIIRSMSSSVTASPTGATPLATPSTSNTPTLRNIDEESDETNIDELRNFLSGGGFSFLGAK